MSAVPVVYYRESLRVPLRWWAVATMFCASVLLAFLVALPLSVALGAAGLLTGLTVLVLASYGAAQLHLADGVFQAGRARIPVDQLADPRPLDRAAARRLAGVEADARAYLLLRPYVGTAVRVAVTDPGDPAPYWLVASRHAETLAAALADAIGAPPAH